MYSAPHTIGANGTVGKHYYGTFGWGMMQAVPTSYSANAWERWYLGWTELRTGSGRADSDIEDAASLRATNGYYTLRDYVTTGDVIRIRIPNTDQHLWLENRANGGPCDTRRGWVTAGDGTALQPAPVGLLAMVEDMADRNTILSPGDNSPSSKVGGLRVVSANGTYDYHHKDGVLSTYDNHLWGNRTFNYAVRPNSTGGESEITATRDDLNGDQQIDVDQHSGNNDFVRRNEQSFLYKLDTDPDRQYTDGLLGPHVGTQRERFHYGIDSNPMIIPHQSWNPATEQLSTIPLNGLSIEITHYDSRTGDLDIHVRLDNTAVEQSTRWTGSLQTFSVDGAVNGDEIYVSNGAVLTLDRSATPQRTTPGPGKDFVNDTELLISTGTSMSVAADATLSLTGAGTLVYVGDGASLAVNRTGHLLLHNGTTVSVQYRSDLDDQGSSLRFLGGRVVVRSTGEVITSSSSVAHRAYPNPGTGSVTMSWDNPAAVPANASAYRYLLQDLQGHTLRQGTCAASATTLANVMAGVYLLVTERPDGSHDVQRVEVQ